MTKISINLPLSRRLDLQMVTRREAVVDQNPILPPLSKLRRMRSGNKLSRIFRHIFEHRWTKNILGANVALAVVATSLAPSNATFSMNVEAKDEPTVISTEISLKTETGVQYPVEEVIVNQGYYLFHPGIDYDGETGDPIRPVMPGYVEAVEYSRFAYGNSIILKHGDNITSLYAHLSKILVEEGQVVDLNTIIGEMGSTGHSTGSHLHLEIREDNYPINPNSILPPQL